MKIHRPILLALLFALLALVAPATAAADGKAGTTLSAEKTAEAHYNRTYEWSIEKSADQEELTLAIGQSFKVNYTIKVNAVNPQDAATISGEICVDNGGAVATEGLAITDELFQPPKEKTPILTKAIDVSSHPVLEPGEEYCYPYTLELTSEQTVPGGDYKNTANITITNHSGHLEEPFGPSPSATTTMPGEPTPECVDVNDTYLGDLGEVCGDEVPWTEKYTRVIGPYEVCGEYTVENVATFENERTDGEASWSIAVDVPCTGGCSLTQGYWKTHSEEGPAPYDVTWDAYEGGAATFDKSGLSWYGLFWTAPQKGNAYVILAHQYMAAVLNGLNGADTTVIEAALEEAEELLYNSKYNISKPPTGKAREKWLELASILAAYNEGYIGPGHCSEDSSSSSSSSSA
jgi:hypothetical protein